MVAPLLRQCEVCAFAGNFDYWQTEFEEIQTEDPSFIGFNGQPDYSRAKTNVFKCPKCNGIIRKDLTPEEKETARTDYLGELVRRKEAQKARLREQLKAIDSS